MKIFVDECVYQLTTELLIQRGHDVVTVQQAGLAGYKNGDVFNYALSDKRIFVTRDMHFSNIFLFPPQNPSV